MSALASGRRWSILPSRPDVEKMLVAELGIGPLVARVMAARGIDDVEEARAFLTPSLERDWADPLEIPGMAEAADRVERAIRGGECIAVFGDFDVDGISSTVLLTLALRRLGARTMPYIPYRFGEGYGLSAAALDRVVAGCSPDLIVTVDNGIASAAEVEELLSRGIDVVVTDHHEPGDLVPAGVPVTDPKLSESCSSRELAGAGVALKLVSELGRRLGQPDLWRAYTDIAALGTLSDMMQLTRENRALVADGVARMRTTDRPGIVALANLAKVDITQITADSLPFSLIPRLNAAGRMGTTDLATELLLTDDAAEAQILAGKLEEINDERRSIEGALAEEALEKVAASYRGERVVVVGGEGWHEGVKGIVASRIVNRFHVPTILFSISDGIARGSGRSVGDVDLFHAVEQCQDVLVRFGGHAGAVGVTCEAARLDEFRARLEAVLAELPDEQFVDHGEVTALCTLGELSVDSIAQLDVLQPFGQGNKKPLLGAAGISMRNRSCVGADASHLRFIAADPTGTVPAIMFRAPRIESLSCCDGPVDLVFEAVNETWQGRTKPKLMVRDILEPPQEGLRPVAAAPGEEGSHAAFVEELFAHADETIAQRDYAGIEEAESFATKAMGVTFEGRQEVVSGLVEGQELALARDPGNPADANAIAIRTRAGAQVGYLRRQISALLAPRMDAGVGYSARVLGVTGGGQGRSFGVNIQVSCDDAAATDSAQALAQARAERERLSELGPAALTDELRRLMIGEHTLLPAQAAALETLAAGRSCLTVMATGRGKSLIFHIHAARTALLDGQASVFVYPLRALVADQAFHLGASLGALGLELRVLTGETSLEERDETFAGLAEGTVDVILTTPEFFAIHSARFNEGHRVGFVVVDEAHHAGLSKSGNRAAYAKLPEILDTLGGPAALAVTATAAPAVAHEICDLMRISPADVIVDRSVRENLSMKDARNVRGREQELVSIVGGGDKCVVYVNSREQAVALARMLRQAIPALGYRIGFYHAGLTRSDRTRIEEAFREGELSCIISTSAFGEGVNLPDIRNVVLYHMPFGQIEFNQMSGRAGRDGAPATVHLMFGERDTRINERIIAGSAPEREDMAALFRTLTAAAGAAEREGYDSFQMTNAQIADAARVRERTCALDEGSVSCGISVFRELGFLTTSGYGSARRISLAKTPARRELTESVRYVEGLRARDEFKEFSTWALESDVDAMLARINRPITPDFGRAV